MCFLCCFLSSKAMLLACMLLNKGKEKVYVKKLVNSFVLTLFQPLTLCIFLNTQHLLLDTT